MLKNILSRKPIIRYLCTRKTNETIFSKIINKEIPADILHEDDKCISFTDINAVSPTHFLVIPKKYIKEISEAQDTDKNILGHLLLIARKVAAEKNLDQGYRIVINSGKHGCRTVDHLHIHVIGGRQLSWPPG